ncbi:COG1470 family protein [Chryseobacterium taichungense]|uniref:COG1470 family protein n=1 Tax=Chryseobacterium taichungense TaxID=295069 RepID=UPI0028AA4E96|nr:hypothetical protein [Chryseobacterium taichungense]
MIRNSLKYIILLFPMLIFAQKNHFVSQDSLQPGTSTSVSLVLENNTSEDKTYDISVETSSSFIIPILKNGELKLPSNEKNVYIIPLKIAAEAPQGKYFIILNGTERNTQEKLTEKFQFFILPNRKLELSTLNFPEFVRAGEKIEANFLLKNNGNSTENLILESKNAVIKESTFLQLLPGENKTITISKATNSQLVTNEYQNISLSVYFAEHPNEKQTAYASVKVISIKPAEGNIFHRLPVAASISWVGMRNRGVYNDGFQGEIYGKGSLDKDNKNLIEFRALTKNPVEFNSFTQYEEYFLNYKRNNISIHLGDKNYSSSFLTEYARYGRGAEIQIDFKNISIGGFYNHPRFFRDIRDEYNVYSKFKLSKESEINVGYLYKIPRTENIGWRFSNYKLVSNAHLPYLTGKFKLNKNLEVLGEASYSKTDESEDAGFMIQTVARYEKFSGNITYMKTGPEFAGYFNNTSTVNGNIQYKLLRKVNLTASFVQDAKNFQRDTLFLAAPYRRFLQYGIQYKYLKSGSLMLSHGFQRYQDRLIPREFDYKERFLRISLDQQIGILQFNIEGQFGQTDNYLTGYYGSSSFYTANIGFEKYKTSFNIYGSYAETARYELQNQKQFYYGARILSRISDRTSFSIFYQNNYMPEDYYTDRNLFELLYHQQILPGHDLDISGRYTLQRGELGNKDFVFSLRYTLHMNIPVQKTAEYISLYGNIDNLGVKRIEGIRLMLGNHLSVTDKQGNFLFKNIIPGEYVLEIDRSTTGINDIPTINIPVSLNLINKENIFNFALTSAARIEGNIHLTHMEEQKSFAHLPVKTEKKKKENIIIEVSNGDQTYRKIAFIGESFDFTYLRPGEWQLKIFRNGLDKRYKIPINQYKFILHPSENKILNIDIIKQQAEVKYQQETIKVSYNEMKKKK